MMIHMRPEISLIIAPTSGVPIYRQVMDQISSQAAGGRLAAGEFLPSVRTLAEHLQVNPMTDAERLVDARRSAGKAVDYYLSPLADHVLKTEPSSLEELRANPQMLLMLLRAYNAPDRTLAEDLVETLARWIRDH